MNAWIFIKEIWRGKDLYRILMNRECENYVLAGKTLDIGSGKDRASYHRFFRKSNDAEIIALDQSFLAVDFEQDKLPYENECADIVLIFNLLEHIYNYSFLLSEIRRVLKPGGKVVGAVPFLVGYHPDPRDYWRFTGESLLKIFEKQNFKEIKIKPIGRGPFAAAYSQAEFMLPRALKLIKLPIVLFLDWLIFKIKPNFNRQKFSLGLFFSGTK